jgi:hypothetical protein
MWGDLRASFRHAFAVPSAASSLTPEEQALLDRAASEIVRRGMTAPATVFLESMGPMNFLGSQALHVLSPLLDLAFKAEEIDQVARLLERRDTLARLITLIESKSALQGSSAR